MAAADKPQREMPTSITEAIGGPLGMAETAAPGIAFVVAYTVSGSNINVSAALAVGLAVALIVVRLVRHESPRHAISGLFGVALGAFIAIKSGKAEDFYKPGLYLNAAYASAFLISILVRWPLVGVLVTKLDGEDNAWREDPRRTRAFRRATWLWVGMFGARLVVQLPLYLASAEVALGVARTAMGLPLFALCLWLSWLLVRGARAPAKAAAPPTQAAGSEQPADVTALRAGAPPPRVES